MKKLGPYVDFLRFKFDRFFESEGESGGAPRGPVDMTVDEVRQYIARRKNEDFTLLDVRQDWEYEELRIPGAAHIPLPELADRAGELDKEKPVLTYCKSGGRSSAAAKLLSGQGFPTVYNMLGGMMAWTGAAAVGEAAKGFDILRGDESPKGVLRAAYGMELLLGRYYADMAGKAQDEETAATFRRLSGFEEKHKARVFKLLQRHDPGASMEELDRLAGEGAREDGLEGGMSGEEYLENLGGAPEDAAEALELAMNIEAQALDLYARLAARDEAAESRETLLLLSEEEKRHLKALGALMDRLGGAAGGA